MEKRDKLFNSGWIQKRQNDFTVCGTGSLKMYTNEFKNEIDEFCKSKQIKMFNDIGCGDKNWIRNCNCFLNDTNYLGYDYVHSSIREKQHNDSDDTLSFLHTHFPSHPKPFNIINETPRNCDATLCKSVLQHLEVGEAVKAIDTIKKTSKYLIIDNSNYDNNIFKITHEGDWKPYNFDIEPFNLKDKKILEIKNPCPSGKKYNINYFVTIYKF